MTTSVQEAEKRLVDTILEQLDELRPLLDLMKEKSLVKSVVALDEVIEAADRVSWARAIQR